MCVTMEPKRPSSEPVTQSAKRQLYLTEVRDGRTDGRVHAAVQSTEDDGEDVEEEGEEGDGVP